MCRKGINIKIDMITDKNIYDKIVDVLNESFKTKERIPKIRERKSFEIIGGKTLLIDIPKKTKIHYHSSSYIIDCDENKKICRTEGTLITDLNAGSGIKKNLENLKCDILAIHDHDTKSVKSTHVHFICKDKSYGDTLSITRFFGKF